MANVKIYTFLPHIFCASFYHLRDINKKKSFQNVGQGHGAQSWQLHNSMAYVEIYKCLLQIFAFALIVSEIQKFQIIDIQKVGQSDGVQTRQIRHSMAKSKSLQTSF